MSKCEQCIARQLNSMRSMTKEELKQVSDSKTSLGYKRGDIIFDEGELLNGVYCIRSGVCKLVKLNSNGKDQTVKLLGKGELIGQRSIISEERTNLSAVALNDVELCYVPKDQILNSLHVNKDFSFDVLQHLAHNLIGLQIYRLLSSYCRILFHQNSILRFLLHTKPEMGIHP